MSKCKTEGCGATYSASTYFMKPPVRRYKKTGEKILSANKSLMLKEFPIRGMCVACTAVAFMNAYFEFKKDEVKNE